MSSFELLALFAIFGGICGFYLSIVGFAVTSLVIVLVVGLVNAVFGGPFTPLLMLGAFVAEQVGFFLAVISRGLALHLARLRAHRAAASDFRAERDHPR